MPSEDERPVGITHVPVRALDDARARGFLQRISLINGPVFCQTAARTPAAAWNVQRDGHIQCRAVDTRLTAGYQEFQPK